MTKCRVIALLSIVWLMCACTALAQQEDSIATVTVCDILRHPELFQGARVRINALIAFDWFGEPFFTDVPTKHERYPKSPCTTLYVEEAKTVEGISPFTSRSNLTEIGKKPRLWQLNDMFDFRVAVSVEGRIRHIGEQKMVRAVNGLMLQRNLMAPEPRTTLLVEHYNR